MAAEFNSSDIFPSALQAPWYRVCASVRTSPVLLAGAPET